MFDTSAPEGMFDTSAPKDNTDGLTFEAMMKKQKS